MKILLYSATLGGGGGISTKTTMQFLQKNHEAVLVQTPNQLRKALKKNYDLLLHHNIVDLLKVYQLAQNKIPIIVTINNLITCMNGTHLKYQGKFLTPYKSATFLQAWIFQYREFNVRPWNEKLFALLNFPFRYVMMKRRLHILNKVDGVIAISPTLALLLYKNGVKRKIYISPQPIDDSFLSKGNEEPYIFYQGGWEPFKGIDILIEAYQKANINLDLRIAGEIRSAQNVRKKQPIGVDVLKQISHDQLRSLTINCTFFVFPSLWLEAFGRGWAEAMCAGKPVIAIKGRGGPSDHITHMENGILAEPTIDSLTQAIKTLATNKKLRKRLGNNAKVFARDHLVASVVVPQLEEIYRRVLR